MTKFIPKHHRVHAATFVEGTNKKDNPNIDINIEGNMIVPKNYDNSKAIVINLKINLSSKESDLELTLETLTFFAVEMEAEQEEISEEEVKKNCLPLALAKMRESVRKVTEAYGMNQLTIPPFEAEDV